MTLSEVAPVGGLSAGAVWGTPVFVLPDGSVATGSVTLTVVAGAVVAVQLDNPTTPPPLPPLSNTGPNNVRGLFGTGTVLILLGAVLLLLGSRRRPSWGRRA